MFIIFLIVDILDVCRPYGAKEGGRFSYKHTALTGLKNGKRNACKFYKCRPYRAKEGGEHKLL